MEATQAAYAVALFERLFPCTGEAVASKHPDTHERFACLQRDYAGMLDHALASAPQLQRAVAQDRIDRFGASGDKVAIPGADKEATAALIREEIGSRRGGLL